MNDKKNPKKKAASSEKKPKVDEKSNETIDNKMEVAEHRFTENTKSVLRTRAKQLAIKEANKDVEEVKISVIEFILGNETYAFETKHVREIHPLKDYTVIPGLPPFILGVVNVRGQIISVVNLKKLINLPEKGLGELNKVIIIENENMEFGILADVIIGTFDIDLNSIQNKLHNSSDAAKEFLKGVTKDHLIIFDANKILNSKDILIKQD